MLKLETARTVNFLLSISLEHVMMLLCWISHLSLQIFYCIRIGKVQLFEEVFQHCVPCWTANIN